MRRDSFNITEAISCILNKQIAMKFGRQLNKTDAKLHSSLQSNKHWHIQTNGIKFLDIFTYNVPLNIEMCLPGPCNLPAVHIISFHANYLSRPGCISLHQSSCYKPFVLVSDSQSVITH